MTDVGDHFKTGERAPVSGVYRFVQSTDFQCQPITQPTDIALNKGEKFPSHRHCQGTVFWRLSKLS